MNDPYSERRYEPNARVVYVDPGGTARLATVKVWWGRENLAPHVPNPASMAGEPTVNLSIDDTPGSTEGSVVHKGNSSAPGRYWLWPFEAREAGLMPDDGTPSPMPTSRP